MSDTTPRIHQGDEIVLDANGRTIGAVRRARSRYAVGKWTYHAVLPAGSTIRGRRGPEEFSSSSSAARALVAVQAREVRP